MVNLEAPYFPFYPGDWLSDDNVRIMTLEEAGAYINLLAFMWKEGCTLRDDDKYLAKLLNVSPKKWNSLRKTLIDGPEAVFSSNEGNLTNNRLSIEWDKALGKIKQNADAAKARWKKSKSGNADAMQTHSGRNADNDESASSMHVRNDAISDPDLDLDPDTEIKDKDPPVSGEVVKAFEQTFGRLPNPVQIEDLISYSARGMEVPLIELAMRKTKRLDKPISYLFGILNNMLDQNILTLAEAQMEQSRREVAVASNKGSTKNGQKDDRYSAFYQLFPDS